MQGKVKVEKFAVMELEIDGYKIHYKFSGKEDAEHTAVILQGWGTKLELYDGMAAVLAEEYRVLQFDLPGFGGSTEPREAWAVEDYMSFFVKLAQTMGLQRVSLIGHSYGGRIIIRLAERMHKKDLPFTIEKIALVDSAGIVPEKTPEQLKKIRRYKRWKKLADTKLARALFPDLIETWKSRQGSEDYRNASPMMRQCLVKAVNQDLREYLPMIPVDTLLVWGDQDTATPLSDAQLMEKMIPQAGLAVIKGAGHFCFIERPAVFNAILQAYFSMKDTQASESERS